ncbi:MAG: class I SAM-dependent methyltransferase [Actinomycetota bacterium]|nr:class I SAM-dependent methyltransferase [Actinomycetota bacterium]
MGAGSGPKLLARAARRAIVTRVPKRHRARLQRLYRPAVALAYRGDAVECPCCGGRFRTFLAKFSAVGRSRPNARCPACGALERHRALALYLRRETRLFTDRLRVLHIAPEPGLEAALGRSGHLHYVTADLEAPAMLSLDVTDLPFGPDEWDVVICNHVLEHVPDDRAAMGEIFRVLAPGGWALLQVPLKRDRESTFEDPTAQSARERERLFGQYDHVRIYGTDYVTRLESAGFDVTVRDLALDASPTEARRHGLVLGDDMFICSKPAVSPTGEEQPAMA